MPDWGRIDVQLLRFPEFLCIGAQKAGTTWLHHNLRSHPDIWLPPVKELHYFNELYIPGHREWTTEQRRKKAIQAFSYHIRTNPEEKWNYKFISCLTNIIDGVISDEWYGKIFAFARNNQICGEITPEYSILPRSGISHLTRLNTNAKIIMLLRDPIDRSWSQIRMLVDRDSGLSVEKAWSFNDVRQRSNYPDILSIWKEYCRDDQLFVGFTDEISGDPLAFLRKICAFLRIPFSTAYFPNANERVFVGVEREPPKEFEDEMRRHFEPVYRKLAADFPDPCLNWSDGRSSGPVVPVD